MTPAGVFQRLLCMLLFGAALTIAQQATACGWWGDGETNDILDVVTVRGDGTIAHIDDAAAESPEEMLRIGDRFRTGSGGLRDLAMAVHWYRAAARSGFAGGQYNLAMMYAKGLGVTRDFRQAAEWYSRAAEQGDVHAQHHLGEMYQRGLGVPQDSVKAAYWFLQAAEQGHADVFTTVAEHYWEGNGVPRDSLLAIMWWRLAAEQGDVSVPIEALTRDAGLSPEVEKQVRELVHERKIRWRQVDPDLKR